MRKLLILLSMCIMMINWVSFAQLCPQWDDTTRYYPGDRVLHGGNAYEALVMIWFWPPPHPIYWEEIPISECYEDECNLQIQLHKTGSVTVDTLPDGNVGTFDWNDGHSVSFDYFCGAGVALKAQSYTGYRFSHWDGVDGSPTNPVVVITIDEDMTVDAVFTEVELCTLTIQLYENGSVAVEYTPDGNVETFNHIYGRSVDLEYYEGDTVRLIAIPDEDYELVDWGDSPPTTTNPLIIVIDENFELSPTYQSGTTTYKAPAECDTAENMQVDGRSRLYGNSELCDGADIKGWVYVMDKLGGDDMCQLTHEKINLGNTRIWRDKVYADEVYGNEVTARNMEIYNTMHTDNTVAQKVRVTQQVFPDFVFKDKNYNLKTIDELEAFIKQNHRLPEISSAEELKKRGLDLGEMSAKLLQKLEEIYLYIIQLEKRVEKLKNSE